MCDVIIIGAGGHGQVIADIINKKGDRFCGFLDDDTSKHGVIGTVDECKKYIDKYFIIGIGNNETREKISKKYPELNYYTAIHPKAIVAENAMIGKGTVVMPNAVINVNAKIGNHCIINTSAVIEHDNIIFDYVHISPGAVLCGTVSVGKKTHIGASAVVKNNIAISDNVLIGCGGVVVNNINKAGTYIGVPVKELNR